MMPTIAKPKLQDKPNHNLQYDIGTDFCIEDPVNVSFHLMINCLLTQELIASPKFQWTVTLNGRDLSYEELTASGSSTFTLNGTVNIGFGQKIVVTCEVSNDFGSDTEKTLINKCDPTQCQDGVTNNCTQECIRDSITGVHKCSCKKGFNFSSDSDAVCEDIDECDIGAHNCRSDNWQMCNNTEGSFECVCERGFNLVEGNCEDINECESVSDRDSICTKLSTCVNTNGTYECICIDGTWKDKSGNCTDINECEEGNHNCSKFATCSVNQGYDCECHIGFVGDGVTCRVSDGFMIGISVVGVVIAMVGFLNMVAVGGIKVKRYCDQHDIKLKFRCRKNQNEIAIIEGNDEAGNRQYVVVKKGSLREKLPPSLRIKSADLRLLNPIGQGEFGIVYKGYLTDQYIDEVVTVKTLKGFIDDEAVQELLRECAKMKDLNHLHVMTLKGVCLDGGPMPFIVLPYMANGSLLSYLKKERSNLTVSVAEGDSGEEEKQSEVLIIKKRLLDMCLQVAKGMEYLTSEKIVHRDLAARNCMISINMIIKVADFGLSVDTDTKDYCRLVGDMGTKLPVKWMAPESLSDCIFSEKSDVWSYGVTCWEIFARGLVPYVGTNHRHCSLYSSKESDWRSLITLSAAQKCTH